MALRFFFFVVTQPILIVDAELMPPSLDAHQMPMRQLHTWGGLTKSWLPLLGPARIPASKHAEGGKSTRVCKLNRLSHCDVIVGGKV